MPVMTVDPARQYSMVLAGVCAELMGPVREIVRVHLRLWCKSQLSFVAELGVTELLTNVHKHTCGGCELLVREMPDGITVEVTDFDDTLPAVKEPADNQESGRGLFLLSLLADDLEFEPLLGGKRVRFRVLAASPDQGDPQSIPF